MTPLALGAAVLVERTETVRSRRLWITVTTCRGKINFHALHRELICLTLRQTLALVITLIAHRAQFIRVDGVDIAFTSKWETLALVVTLEASRTEFVRIGGVDITFTARIETSEHKQRELMFSQQSHISSR